MAANGRIAASEIIRPAAVVPEDATRLVLMRLALLDMRTGGLWETRPNLWARWDRPWAGGEQGEAKLLGTIEIAYGTPSRYEVTIYRVSITDFGEEQGFTVRSVVDEALGFAQMTLDDCPRSNLTPPPPPTRI